MEQTRVAFHEAGHAVVSCYFGIVVEELSIRPIVDSLGRVAMADTPAKLRTGMYARLRRAAESRSDQSIRIVTDWRRPRNLFDDEANFHSWLHVLVAGMVAEEMRFKSHFGGDGDQRRFHLFVSCLYGHGIDVERTYLYTYSDRQLSGSSVALDKLLLDRYWNSCWKILSEPETWGWVEAVAKAAVESEYGVLSGDEIESLRPPWRPPPAPFAKAG
jgi:hypothetical protein